MSSPEAASCTSASSSSSDRRVGGRRSESASCAGLMVLARRGGPGGDGARRVLLDVRADDLEATGLVLPGTGVQRHRGRGGAPSVFSSSAEREPPTGPEVCSRLGGPVEGPAGEQRAGRPSARRRRACPRRGCSRSQTPGGRGGSGADGWVGGGSSSRSPEPERLVAAAVPGGQGVVGVVAGAVGPPVGLDHRAGLVARAGRAARRRRGSRPSAGRTSRGPRRRTDRRAVPAPGRELVAGRLVARDAVAGESPRAVRRHTGDVEAGAERPSGEECRPPRSAAVTIGAAGCRGTVAG